MQKFRRLPNFNIELSPLPAYAIALLCSFVLLNYLFRTPFFWGVGSFFESGDNAQHVSGWWYYVKDVWSLSILHTSRLNYPYGTNIAFTDSIPIAAVLFKSLISLFPYLLPEHFHYFGLWVGVVFISQALSAALFIRSLGEKRVLALVVSVVFSLTWPVIHERYSHAALMTHSIMICALSLYFMGVKQQINNNKISFLFTALSLIALTVHPYFLPMTICIYLAYSIDHAKYNGIFKSQLINILLFFVIISTSLLLLGYFESYSKAPGATYGGTYHLNLLSPFCGNSKIFGCNFESPIVRFEGYNYFGAGLIMLIPLSIFLSYKVILKLIVQYTGLAITVLVLTFYSITNHIFLGNTEILYFSIPTEMTWITEKFRAAGRFFWIVGYLILFLTIFSISKWRSYFSGIVLLLAAGVQIIDIKPEFSHIRKIAASQSKIDYKAWESIVRKIDHAVVYPTFGCSGSDFSYISKIQHIMAFHGKTLNTAYTATSRYDCENHFSDILNLKQSTAYLISDYSINQLELTGNTLVLSKFVKMSKAKQCMKIEDGLACIIN